ncbi:methyltransferase domain-containing protein [Kocuria sp. CPCC 205263]|uniref:methyltransferase domain-containing protein n=1 Tax=Kocuria sp. CPCC 205263 TaxID=3073555 RepID=UPI0034D50F10
MPRYGLGYAPSVLLSHAQRTAENSAAYLLPHLRPDMVVLDAGCGPGSITLDLAGYVPEGRVVGVDVGEEALVVARGEAARRGDTRTEFQLADITGLPFPDGAFDVVHAHQVLQHVADPVAALQEMTRVCRPDGWIACRDADYEAMTWYPTSPGMTRWLETYRAMARLNGGEPDAGRRLKSWCLQAGLTKVQADASTWCYTTPESTQWWSRSWAQRARTPAFADRARELGLATSQEVELMVEDWLRWGAAENAWFVLVHGEVLARPSRSQQRDLPQEGSERCGT